MSHPNSGDKTLNARYNGAPVPGDLLESFVQLTLLLLASRDAAESLSSPAAEMTRQVNALAPNSLAAQHFSRALNSQISKEASGQ
jgi:hypothetical protein